MVDGAGAIGDFVAQDGRMLLYLQHLLKYRKLLDQQANTRGTIIVRNWCKWYSSCIDIR